MLFASKNALYRRAEQAFLAGRDDEAQAALQAYFARGNHFWQKADHVCRHTDDAYELAERLAQRQAIRLSDGHRRGSYRLRPPTPNPPSHHPPARPVPPSRLLSPSGRSLTEEPAEGRGIFGSVRPRVARSSSDGHAVLRRRRRPEAPLLLPPLPVVAPSPAPSPAPLPAPLPAPATTPASAMGGNRDRDRARPPAQLPPPVPHVSRVPAAPLLPTTSTTPPSSSSADTPASRTSFLIGIEQVGPAQWWRRGSETPREPLRPPLLPEWRTPSSERDPAAALATPRDSVYGGEDRTSSRSSSDADGVQVVQTLWRTDVAEATDELEEVDWPPPSSASSAEQVAEVLLPLRDPSAARPTPARNDSTLRYLDAMDGDGDSISAYSQNSLLDAYRSSAES